jgi:hypothetical protein
MDALDKKASNELKNQGKSFRDAKREAPERAAAMFKDNYISKLDKVKHRPSQIVQLRGTCMISYCLSIQLVNSDMHKPGTRCNELLSSTAKALNPKALKLLYRSMQQNNLELYVEHAVKK